MPTCGGRIWEEPASRGSGGDGFSAALKDPTQKNNRDHVDVVIALGMAKEGFDWIWCEHALTVGNRSILTDIVQTVGRATRDAPGKTRARFTNLIAEPDAAEETVTEAVNDTLKAIAASLLMEQVLAPRFEFRPKNPNDQPIPGLDYGEDGCDPEKCNVGVNPDTCAATSSLRADYTIICGIGGRSHFAGTLLRLARRLCRFLSIHRATALAPILAVPVTIRRSWFDVSRVIFSPSETTPARLLISTPCA